MTSATGDFEFEKTLLPRNAGAAACTNAKRQHSCRRDACGPGGEV